MRALDLETGELIGCEEGGDGDCLKADDLIVHDAERKQGLKDVRTKIA
jgi:hypothetical protein